MTEVHRLWNRLLLDAKGENRSSAKINNEIREVSDEVIRLYREAIANDLMEKDGIDYSDSKAQEERWDK